MNDDIDELLRTHLVDDSPGDLPSNFAWLVQRRVMGERVANARKKAFAVILLASAGVLLAAAGLVTGWWWYNGVSVTQLQLPQMAGISLGIVALLLIVDAGLGLQMTRRRP